MKKYNVTGMTCAACAARVEKAVNGISAVESCAVNLLTNTITVNGEADEAAVISAIQKAGYGASLYGGKKQSSDINKPNNSITLRLISSAVILLILMNISMGHGMFGLPLPPLLSATPTANALTQLLLSAAVMIINQKFFISGFKGLINHSPNMDTLIALGSAASFIYSTANLFLMLKNTATAHQYLHDLYFEAAAMILVIITVGKLLEERSKGKTTSAIEALIKLSPKTATVIIDGKEQIRDITEVAIGDIFIVRPGESIPVDAEIIEGYTTVNEAALTGESLPKEKQSGDKVYAATINGNGFIKCRATKVGEDTSFAKIIQLVSDAAATKAPIGKIADKVSGIFVPIVLSISLVTLIVWLLLDATLGFALARAVSVLVISCPCALGLATPVAIMVGNGIGAKNGILFKSAEVLEKTAKAKTICFDKTGTITEGHPEVTDIYPISCEERELITFAASLEKQSEHPLSKAIMKKSEEMGVQLFAVTEFEAVTGGGIEAKMDNNFLFGGNYRFIKDRAEISEEIFKRCEALSVSGKTPMLFAENGTLLGIIAVADTIKKDSADAIKKLHRMGIKTVMITGDNERTAKRIAAMAGIDEVYAELLPEDKNSVIEGLKNDGAVIMVGDGINDAPALTSADIGIALGSGSDIAIDAGDIVLTHGSLNLVPAAITLSKKTLKTIHGNLFWAFFYNALCIPLAAGVFYNSLGLTVSPMLAAAAMSLSDICVVGNALRLNFFDIFKERKISMKKTIKIEGMMCPHCENRVKTILEELSEVSSADVSHKSNTAVLKLDAEISNDAIEKVITNAGYKVIEIK